MERERKKPPTLDYLVSCWWRHLGNQPKSLFFFFVFFKAQVCYSVAMGFGVVVSFFFIRRFSYIYSCKPWRLIVTEDTDEERNEFFCLRRSQGWQRLEHDGCAEFIEYITKSFNNIMKDDDVSQTDGREIETISFLGMNYSFSKF